MPFHADAVTLTLTGLLAAAVVGILAWLATARLKAGRSERDMAAIRVAIVDYFRRSGVGVAVDCVATDGKFTAMIESEPMKRFRLSHIIEMTVRDHVRKTCGRELDKIYWRFPIKEAVQAVQQPGAQQPASEQKQPDPLSDEYINEGLEHYRHIPKPEVEEVPWESFEQVAISKPRPDGEH